MQGTNLQFSQEDYQNLQQYIQSKNTAILVVMFTDIEGFTRLAEEYGDVYTGNLRKEHDSLLTQIIEEDNAGKIIKFIGDAVMAVFAEPTTAVAKSVDIQEALARFNRNHEDLVDIKVRIGLHMGQVSIEKSLKADVFGRHVNRASRVESLASGDQILMTFPVFDSAMGWMREREDLGWKNHGYYQLKGIKRAAEIYEVYKEARIAPRKPRGNKQGSGLPAILPPVVGFLLGSLLTWGGLSYEKTSVTFVDFPFEDTLLMDQETPLYLDGEHKDHIRSPLEPIKPGLHILQYDINAMSRYYAEIEVKRGANSLDPVFQNSYIPQSGNRLELGEKRRGEREELDKDTYFTYQNKERKDYEVTLWSQIKAEPKGEEGTIYNVHYKVIQNGTEIASGVETFTWEAKDDSVTRFDYIQIWSDDIHNFGIRGYYGPNYMDVTLGGQFNR